MKKNKLKLCTIQPDLHRGELGRNLAGIRDIVAEAVKENEIDLVVIPENFVKWGSLKEMKRGVGEVVEFLSSLAKDFSINLVGGSFHHIERETGRFVNQCLVFDRNGQETGRYNKRRMYKLEIINEVVPGERDCIVEIEGWKVGILICADLWYPEFSRDIHSRIDILAVPAQTVGRGPEYREYVRRLWNGLVLTRSQENSVITVVSDHSSLLSEPYSAGVSSICDPSRGLETGDVDEIQLVLAGGKKGHLIAELDNGKLKAFRDYRAESGILPKFAI